MDTNAPSTDLATIAATKLTKSLGKSSLQDFVAGKVRRTLMLVDCSSSMNGHIMTGETKIEKTRTVVGNIRRTRPVPVAAFGHRGNVVEVVDAIPHAAGMTPLHLAIEFGTGEGANHLIVVTDGQPDSEPAAFSAAKEFGGPIDVVYIGDGDDRGYEFSKELASMTGGKCDLADLARGDGSGGIGQLEGKILLFLGDGSDTL